MTRGEIYRSRFPAAEQGGKRRYLVIVSRNGIADNELVETVVCAPIYSRWRGMTTEVPLTRDDGVDHDSAIRCDFLTLVLKRHLTHFAGSLSPPKLRELDRAIAVALGLPSRAELRH